jgi:hypothetical protein
MWPKEHGAYGQLLFPLGTALAVGRPGGAALLLALSALCAFFAHEPLVVLLGQRGPRAARDQRARAMRWLGSFAAASTLCGATAIALASPDVRLAIVPSAALAALVVLIIVTQRERTMPGELLTAVALASLARPIALASAAAPIAATTCAVVFACVFVAGTVGVRAVIACTRHPPASGMRAIAAVAAVVFVALLWVIARAGLAASSAPWAALPVCGLAVVLAAAPPSAKQLRAVGWALVGTTAASAGLLIATLR